MTPTETLRIKNWARRSLVRGLRAVGLNHVVAAALIRVHDALDRRPLAAGCLSVVHRCEAAVRDLPGQLFRFAGDVDDKAPCPNCGKPEALVHLATLKTYCWACSYWGHDPKNFAEDVERQERDARKRSDPAKT